MSEPSTPPRAEPADFELIRKRTEAYASGTAARLLRDLEELDAPIEGAPATRLDHALQAATLAWRDGADQDWVVSALLHDVGELYAPYNHDEYAAAVLRPFVRAQCVWTVANHGAFQAAQRGVPGAADACDSLRSNPYFDDGVEFCRRWDSRALAARAEAAAKPLSFFAPMVERTFGRAPYDPAVMRPGERAPLADQALAQARRDGD